MNYPGLVLWLFPLLVISVAFFTSAIKRFTFQRYTILSVVLFFVFLLDLQATSFTLDIIDAIVSNIVLFVVADLLWRGIKNKHKILRFASLSIALTLLLVTYRPWVKSSPKNIYSHYVTTVVEHSKAVKGFYIKKEGLVIKVNGSTTSLVLYKKRAFSLLERRLSSYVIPEGYQNDEFRFHWRYFEHRIAADCIANTDTLWTLTDPGAPK